MEQQGYEEEEEDLYDFSGLSLQDFQENNAEEDEWMPPTPPPYDIAARLEEANRRLDEEPFPDDNDEGDDEGGGGRKRKLRWRSDSRLVEVRWLQKEEGSSSLSTASDSLLREEIVMIEGDIGRFLEELGKEEEEEDKEDEDTGDEFDEVSTREDLLLPRAVDPEDVKESSAIEVGDEGDSGCVVEGEEEGENTEEEEEEEESTPVCSTEYLVKAPISSGVEKARSNSKNSKRTNIGAAAKKDNGAVCNMAETFSSSLSLSMSSSASSFASAERRKKGGKEIVVLQVPISHDEKPLSSPNSPSSSSDNSTEASLDQARCYKSSTSSLAVSKWDQRKRAERRLTERKMAILQQRKQQPSKRLAA